MAKAKVVNYSQELTDQIVKRYCEGTTDDERKEILQELSAMSGKTVKSIVAKLVREKVYVKAAYVAKTGNKPETKAAIVTAIAKTLGVAEDRLQGLENATKPTLELLRATFKVAREAIAEATEAVEESNAEVPAS